MEVNDPYSHSKSKDSFFVISSLQTEDNSNSIKMLHK